MPTIWWSVSTKSSPLFGSAFTNLKAQPAMSERGDGAEVRLNAAMNFVEKGQLIWPNSNTQANIASCRPVKW